MKQPTNQILSEWMNERGLTIVLLSTKMGVSTQAIRDQLAKEQTAVTFRQKMSAAKLDFDEWQKQSKPKVGESALLLAKDQIINEKERQIMDKDEIISLLKDKVKMLEGSYNKSLQNQILNLEKGFSLVTDEIRGFANQLKPILKRS